MRNFYTSKGRKVHFVNLRGAQEFEGKEGSVNLHLHFTNSISEISFIFSKIYFLFIYLFYFFLAVSGLSCSMQDLF